MLFKPQIHFLRHIITNKGIMIYPMKVDVIMNWPHLINVDELQFFFGYSQFLLDVYLRLCKDYDPHHDRLITRNKVLPFQWSEDQQRSFDKLKLAMSIAPILLLVVDLSKPFFVETDGSSTAISTVLI